MSEVLAPVRPIFRAVACEVVPEAVSLDDAGWAEVEGVVENALSRRPPKLKRQLRVLMRAIQWLPVLRFGGRFTKLDSERRRRFLTWLESQSVKLLRCGFWGLRTLCLMGYYGRPCAAEEIGYTADVRGWEAVR